jgi:glutamate 5-kinase
VRDARRIVIKLGTRVLTRGDNTVDEPVLGRIVSQAAALLAGGREVMIVTSGAIALGLRRMGLDTRPREINLLQAAASLGQSRLMQAYERKFADCGCETAQVLLTLEDIQSRERYLNIRNTMVTLWQHRAVPVVNENDTVSFEEITFGDNDVLSAHLANMIDADLLVLLSDIDGFYSADPKTDPSAKLIPTVERVEDRLFEFAQGKGSAFSLGGMESKLRAARIATRSGVGVVIARGKSADLAALFAGADVGSFFVPAPRHIRGKRKWIAFNPKVSGTVVIDAGGEKAVVEGRKSLLPAGVTEVTGRFGRGSTVAIVGAGGREIARGLTNFSSDEIARIKGLRSDKIAQVLGSESYFHEVVHRDNMVVVPPE